MDKLTEAEKAALEECFQDWKGDCQAEDPGDVAYAFMTAEDWREKYANDGYRQQDLTAIRAMLGSQAS